MSYTLFDGTELTMERLDKNKIIMSYYKILAERSSSLTNDNERLKHDAEVSRKFFNENLPEELI